VGETNKQQTTKGMTEINLTYIVHEVYLTTLKRSQMSLFVFLITTLGRSKY